jgi:hypothetical protein
MGKPKLILDESTTDEMWNTIRIRANKLSKVRHSECSKGCSVIWDTLSDSWMIMLEESRNKHYDT